MCLHTRTFSKVNYHGVAPDKLSLFVFEDATVHIHFQSMLDTQSHSGSIIVPVALMSYDLVEDG